jgi:serine phosphatase RsbU (regulator of sigma subunit)
MPSLNDALGATARLEWTEAPGRREVFPLSAARVLIGRRSDADISLSHRLASRQHAHVVREGDAWVLMDLGSTHGTWINGQRVERHTLKPNDRIRLGGTEGIELVFFADDEGSATDSSLLTGAGLDHAIRRLAEIVPSETTAHSELEKISCLLDFHYYFGKVFSAEKAFLHVLKSALQISGAERGFVLRREKDGFAYALGLDAPGNLLNEAAFQTSRSVVDRVTAAGEPFFMTQGIQGDLAEQASIVAMNLSSVACLPLISPSDETGDARIMGILYLDSRKHMHSLSGLDERVLTRLADEAGHVLEKLEMLETLAERQRVEQELALAEETQRTLLPQALPEFAPYRIRAFSRPTRQLGGDFYDFIRTGHELATVLGDVSGKGISAALLSSLTLGALSTEYRSSSQPELVLNEVNRFLCQKTPANRFVTLFLCQFDRGGKGCFLSAGHNTSFIFRAATGGLEELGSGGVPLGMFPFVTYQSSAFELGPGDLLAVYSDGLTDAENRNGEDFGEGKLRALIQSVAPEGAEALEAALLAALDRFCGAAPQTDDITFVLIGRERLD